MLNVLVPENPAVREDARTITGWVTQRIANVDKVLHAGSNSNCSEHVLRGGFGDVGLKL